MKLATAIDHKGESFIGLVINNDQQIINLNELGFSLKNETLPKNMIDIISGGDDLLTEIIKLVEIGGKEAKLESVTAEVNEIKLLPPIPRPQKNIFCVGKNYREHAIEMGSEADIPEDLIVFTKAPTTVIGQLDEIPNHKTVTESLDYEGELAIVIGKSGRDIRSEAAIEYIYGYTIVNDVTARDLQSRHKQFFLGKSLDGTCPIGPWIVHKSAIPNPENLTIETKVNGEVRQQCNTNQFIFSIGEIIETLSRGMTLEVGDIIATGTPAGVGKGFNPPRFLKPGDRIEINIQGIGTLTNQVKK